jgi:integrase
MAYQVASCNRNRKRVKERITNGDTGKSYPLFLLPVVRSPEMARQAYRLTDLEIRQAKPDRNGIKRLVLLDGYGLRLVITPAGRKYWQFKTAAGGKEQLVQLGIYPAMGLDDARKRSDEVRGVVREGRSPVIEGRILKIRNRTQTATTFEGVAIELLEGKAKNVSPAYYKKISGAIKANLYPMLGPLPIQSIDAPILRAALRKIEERGSLEMLGNVRRWAGEVFDLAKANGQFKGDNPATSLLRNVFKKHSGERMRALDWIEIPDFMKGLDSMSGELSTAIAVRLILLTACRPGEVRGAKWTEFDVDGARWEIPGERMKMRQMHAVPLSRQVLALLGDLRKLTGHSEYLFPARVGAAAKHITDMTVLKAVKRAAGRDVHAHGLRAVFSTHVGESLKWPDAVKEAALAHYKGGVEGKYDRATHYKERAKLMQWYADEIDAAVKGAKVIPLQRKTAIQRPKSA